MSLNTMCRCCLVRPPNKDLKSVYTCQGKTEVYGDMLKDCFEIQLSIEPCDSENGICELCIARLRDASDFKHQVLRCQKEFQIKLNKSSVDETPQIKEEESDSEENDISTVAEEERQDNAGELEVEKHSCPRLLRPGPRSAQSRPGPRRRRRGRSFVNQNYPGSDPISASDSSDEYQSSCKEDEEIEMDSDDSVCDESPNNITPAGEERQENAAEFEVEEHAFVNQMNAYEIFEFLEADARDSRLRNRQKRRRMMLRRDFNPFDLSEAEFVKRYRLTKPLVRKLCDELRPMMKVTKKSTDLSVEMKILIALSFYANGSYQCRIGNNEGHFVAQQTVSSVIAQVTKCLNTPQMREKYIKFPMTGEERNRVKAEFYKKIHIPGVLGCIGCTQVAIVRPAQNGERFYCSKNYHSLNVQLICDAEMQIIDVDASHGGASHESLIWTNHPLRIHLEELSNSESIWLLGDSGYPLRKTMMTPILEAAPGSPEEHYTNMHVRAKNIIEQTIGLLKARFRCLLVHRVLHYSPQVAGSIINACVILHNICNRAKTPVQQLSDEDLSEESQLRVNNELSEQPHRSNMPLQQGITTRNFLVQQLWERRNLEY